MVQVCLLLCLLLASCAPGPAHPDWIKGQSGIVARVIDGDSLVLSDGLVVRLVSIEAPSLGSRDRDAMPYSEDAKAELERLALGRRVQLYYPGLTQDRYERALAQVFATDEAGNDIWINETLVREGAAWVRVYADTMVGSDALWAAEDIARGNSAGIWGASSPVSSIEDAMGLDGRFTIVTSRLGPGEIEDGECMHRALARELIVHYNASRVCEDVSDTLFEIRGWARNGRLYAGSHSNIRPATSTD